MKQESRKTRTERRPRGLKTAAQPCGTLSYLAECRGSQAKAASSRLTASSDAVDRMVRKLPAER